MLALQNVLEMKSKHAKVDFLFTHIFSNNVHSLFSNSVLYFQFVSFVWTKNAMPNLARIQVHSNLGVVQASDVQSPALMTSELSGSATQRLTT